MELRQNQLMAGSAVPELVAGYEFRCYWFEIFECVRNCS